MIQSYQFHLHTTRNETFKFAVTFPKPTKVNPIGPWENGGIESRVMEAAVDMVQDAYGPGEWVGTNAAGSISPMNLPLPSSGGEDVEFELVVLERQQTS